MIEKTLIAIIAVVFLLSSWWWSNRQSATENFYEAQLSERDAVITQLRTLALPQVQNQTPKTVQDLFHDLFPRQEVRHEKDVVFSGVVGVRFSEDAKAIGFLLPWDVVNETSSQ